METQEGHNFGIPCRCLLLGLCLMLRGQLTARAHSLGGSPLLEIRAGDSERVVPAQEAPRDPPDRPPGHGRHLCAAVAGTVGWDQPRPLTREPAAGLGESTWSEWGAEPGHRGPRTHGEDREASAGRVEAAAGGRLLWPVSRRTAGVP